MKKSYLLAGAAMLVAAAAVWNFAPRGTDATAPAAGNAATLAQDPEAYVPGQAFPPATATASGLPRMTPQQAQRHEALASTSEQAKPPQTYIGPDGKEHAIVYNQGLNLDSHEVRQLEQQILKDMREHPEVFVGLHGLEKADVEAIIAGKKKMPREIVAKIVM